MKEKALHSIYNMVCDTPFGSSLHIDHMPEFFSYDNIDNQLAHVHTFYEILWFFEAGGKHTVDFQEYEIEENSMFFLSPGQVHHFDGETKHKGILIQFCTDFLSDEKADEDIFIKYNVFNAFDSSPYCTIKNEKVILRLKEIVGLMEEELAGKDKFGQLDMLRSLVKLFLINVQRHGERQDAPKLDAMKPAHKLFVMFRQLLEQEYDNLHSVKEYADRLNVSVKTLSNCISECSDKSTLTFINDRILLEAKRLLQYTDLSMKEIAYRLGYEDSSYFVKFFKRNMGYLPTDFRTNAMIKQSHSSCIAVTQSNQMVASAIGDADEIMLFYIGKNSKIVSTNRLPSPTSFGNNLPRMLREAGVTTLITTEIGKVAHTQATSFGIDVVLGYDCATDEAVDKVLRGLVV